MPGPLKSGDELVRLADELDLHPLAVEDAIHARQRPKYERFGDVLAVALKPLRYVEDDRAVETGEMMLFVGPRFVLGVRHGPVDPCIEAARRLDADPDMLRLRPRARAAPPAGGPLCGLGIRGCRRVRCGPMWVRAR
ncbi:CorA family divalent cation transporter [Streptomyces sp. NPDC056883]|uniref:CorA family divalent cation transporter n=1 Tax=Streptomyces sp. NPDC056883 TaxID=3345959 RepID=UPI0036A8F975